MHRPWRPRRDSALRVVETSYYSGGVPELMNWLVHRLVELLPGVITSLETCGLAEEARLVKGMFQGGKDKMESGDLSGAIRAVLRIQFVYK